MGIKPIKVSQVNGYVKRILQTDPLLGSLHVIGEVSNLKIHGTGHVYFTLKDEASRLNCFLPSDQVQKLRFELAEGMEITAVGYIYVYEKGGSYSLNVKDIFVEGTGSLSIAFQQLKDKLEKEGLFDSKFKKTIPPFPKKIAVITSETGAAVRDIIKIIKQRNDIINVIVYPCLVQGTEAARDISGAIQELNKKFPDVDTIIVGRGGGSIEELWPFNEEIVARSIFLSEIPIISAVGHETDFTIADFAADKRAATPTEAAQLAAPDTYVLRQYVSDIRERLSAGINGYLQYFQLRSDNYNIPSLRKHILDRIKISIMKADKISDGMYHMLQDRINSLSMKSDKVKAELQSGNPYEIMKRGYAAVLKEDGLMATGVEDFKTGDFLTVLFKNGKINSHIKEIWRNSDGE